MFAILLWQVIKIKRARLYGRVISYKLRKNIRAKRVSVSIGRDGGVTLTVPRFVPEKVAETFLIAKSSWVLSKLDEFRNLNLQKNLLREKYPLYKNSREEALKIIKKKVEEVNKFYNFSYNKVSVKNQKTCWGSCSGKGNLNFNYKLAYLDSKYADYVVTHEICHLKQHNHSKKFWDLVAQRLPNYKQIQKEMKSKGLELR